MADLKIRNEGAVGASRGQWAIPMKNLLRASRSVVLIQREYDNLAGTGSVVTYTDKATNQTVLYLLTSMSCIENMDEAKDSMISFSRDDLEESDDLVKVPGEKLFDSTSAPHIKKFTEELNYAMFPLNKEELRKVYGIQNEAPDDKIHHLSLDGVDMKSHMVLYIIHYTKMADGKYRKCVNSRFAMPDTGPQIFHCVTTYRSSRGAPLFTVHLGLNGEPYLRFVGMDLGEREKSTPTKILEMLPFFEKGDKVAGAEYEVEINYGIKISVIQKHLQGDLKEEDLKPKFHLPTTLATQLYAK